VRNEVIKLCDALEKLALQVGRGDVAARVIGVRAGLEPGPVVVPTIELACEGEGVQADAIDDGPMWSPPTRSLAVGERVEVTIAIDGKPQGRIGRVVALDQVAIDLGDGFPRSYHPGDVRSLR
jgi:hypothetical protein